MIDDFLFRLRVMNLSDDQMKVDIELDLATNEGASSPLDSIKDIKGRRNKLSIAVEGPESKLLKLVLFAVVLFFVSYLPFITALELLRKFYEQT